MTQEKLKELVKARKVRVVVHGLMGDTVIYYNDRAICHSHATEPLDFTYESKSPYERGIVDTVNKQATAVFNTKKSAGAKK